MTFGAQRVRLFFLILWVVGIPFFASSSWGQYTSGDRIICTTATRARPNTSLTSTFDSIAVNTKGTIVGGPYIGSGNTLSWFLIRWDTLSADRYTAEFDGTGTRLFGIFSPSAITLSTSQAPYWDSSPPAGPVVPLQWNQSQRAQYFEVYRNGQFYARIDNPNATSFTNNAGLSAGATYTFLVAARRNDDALSFTQSNTLMLTMPSQPQSPPSVTTNAASGITASSATLNLTVNPNGAATTAYFEHGLTTSYGSTTTPGNFGSGNSSVSGNSVWSGLQPNTTYHYRAVASNSGGTSYGSDVTFSTLPPPSPTVSRVVAGQSEDNHVPASSVRQWVDFYGTNFVYNSGFQARLTWPAVNGLADYNTASPYFESIDSTHFRLNILVGTSASSWPEPWQVQVTSSGQVSALHSFSVLPYPEGFVLQSPTTSELNGSPTVNLNWGASSYAEWYIVERDGVTLSPTLSSSARSYTDNSSLNRNQSYSYRIKAINRVGSIMSNFGSVTIPAANSPVLTNTFPTAGSYQAGAPIPITWTLTGDTSHVDRLRIAILENGVEIPGQNFRPANGATSYSWQPGSAFLRNNLTVQIQAFSASNQLLATANSAVFSTVATTTLQARITPITGNVYLNRPVTFSAAGSVAATGRPITSYSWAFFIGNAQVGTAMGQSATITFVYGNEARAELTVSDGFNTNGPVSLTVPLLGIGDPSKTHTGTSADPVNTATGNFVMSLPLMEVHGRGLPFVFQAFYNSKGFEAGDTNPGPLGFGWSHSFETRIEPVTLEDGIPYTTIMFGDGHPEKFRFEGTAWTAQAGNYNKLSQSSDGLFTLTTPNQLRHRFDAFGRLTTISDRNGNTLTIVWNDSPSRIVRVELPGGPDPANPRKVLFDYDAASGHLAKLTDPLGRTVEFTVDANHDLVAYKNPRSKSTSYTYDALHQMLNGTNPRNNQFVRNVYQDRLVIEQYDVDNHKTAFVYNFNPSGNSTTRITRFAAGGDEITDDIHDQGHRLVERRVWLDATNYLSTRTEYDPVTGDPVKDYDRNGNATSYQWLNGNRTQVKTADGAETNITYNAANDPLLITKPDNTVERHDYDAKGNPTEVTYPYDPAHPTNYRRSIIVDAYGQPTSFTDANNNATLTFFTSWGEAWKTQDAEGFYETSEFDGISRRTVFTDKRGNRTAFTLNENSGVEVTTLPDPSGPTTIKQTFDANDNRTELEDQLQRKTQFVFDKQDRQVQAINALLQTSGVAFDELGRAVTAEDAKHHFSHKVYDLASRIVSATDEAGRTHHFTTDANGNILTDVDDDGVKVETIYDSMNRPTKTRRYTASTVFDETETHYNAMGRVDWIKNAKGLIYSIYYNDAGQLIRLVEPSVGGANPAEFTWTYDFEGRLLTATHPSASGPKTRSQAWTPRNQIATRTDELNRTEQLFYNAANLIDHTINADLQRLDYAYDSLNRLTRITPPTGPPIVFTYDAAGQRIYMDDELGRTTWTYTPLGQIETCTNPFNKTLEFGYDANGNRNRVTYPGQKVASYTFDDSNILLSVSDWVGHTISRTLTAAGRIATIGYPGNVTTTIGHDAAGRESDIQHQIGTALPFIHFGYEFDELSAIKKITPNVSPAVPSQFAAGISNYSYDAANQLVTTDGIAVTHDNRGNVLTGKLSPTSTGTDSLVWDAYGRLKSYTIAGVSGSHGYSGLGHRLQTTHAGTTRRFVVDGSAGLAQVMADTDGDGTISAYYLYLGGLAARVLPGGSISCYHSDRQGNVLALTDGAGSITDLYKYDEFGVLLGSMGSTANPFRYAGSFGVQTDANGTLFSRARYYHADWGRFLSQDALFGSQQNGQSLNRYAAFLNDPITFSDPSGFTSEHGVSPSFYEAWMREIREFGTGFAQGALWSIETADLPQGSLVSRSIGMSAGLVVSVFDGVLIVEKGYAKLVASSFAKELGANRTLSLLNFLYDAREFRAISREYWAARGPANGRSLHHWLIPQSSKWAPQGLKNAGWNLLELPAFKGVFHKSLGLNQWMGFAQKWGGASAGAAFTMENGIRFGIPAAIGGTAYGAPKLQEYISSFSNDD